MTDMEKIGRNIKRVRLKTNLTQAQFGHVIGRSQSTINDYERGKRLPPYATILKIAEMYDVDPDGIFDLRENSINRKELEKLYALYERCVKRREKQKKANRTRRNSGN